MLVVGLCFSFYESYQGIQLEKQIYLEGGGETECPHLYDDNALDWLDRVKIRLWEDDRPQRCLDYKKRVVQLSIPNPALALRDYVLYLLPGFSFVNKMILVIGLVMVGGFYISGVKKYQSGPKS